MNFKKIKRKIFSGNRIKIGGEIQPEEIFLDSSNLPQFDTHQFEGRLEKPISKVTFVWFSVVVFLIGSVFFGRLFMLQVAQGNEYRERSENNHLRHTTIFANRGIIYDRNKIELAQNILNTNGDFSLRSYAPISGVAHLVGYVKYPSKDKYGVYYNNEFNPKDGVELEFNEKLSGSNGLKITETDALGNVQSESVLTSPKDGENITLSIDSAVNQKLYELMHETVIDREFVAGAGVIMDINTGEILAISSYPEYDQNVMTSGGDSEKIQNLLNHPGNPFLNRAVAGQFIPGSIIKPFVAMGVLSEGIIDPMKQILSTGSISIPNPYDETKKTIFKDWKAHGLVDLRHALAVSSNVYFFTVGGGHDGQKGIGIANIEKYTKLFGFGSKTGIDLFGEESGNVPSLEWKKLNYEDGDWRVGDTYNSSIGQYGFQVTPIQGVRAVASLANGGILVTPTILKDNKPKSEPQKLPFLEENFKIICEGMRLSVLEGTAKGLLMPGITVAAKTGTAELGSAKALVNSWVMGYFPYENPRYAFLVLMEKGPYANQIGATSIMRQLFEWMYINTPEYVL